VREPGTTILNVPSAQRMEEVGGQIGAAIDAAADGPFILALEGDLGAGKTTLVRGILRAFGITGAIRSPTYTLIEPYETARRPLYHLDLYRLVDPAEVEPLGLRDLLTVRQGGGTAEERSDASAELLPAVLLIEWPSRAAGAIPAADVWVDIVYPSHGTEGRELRLTPHSPSGHNAMRHIVAAIPELRQLSS